MVPKTTLQVCTYGQNGLSLSFNRREVGNASHLPTLILSRHVGKHQGPESSVGGCRISGLRVFGRPINRALAVIVSALACLWDGKLQVTAYIHAIICYMGVGGCMQARIRPA